MTCSWSWPELLDLCKSTPSTAGRTVPTTVCWLDEMGQGTSGTRTGWRNQFDHVFVGYAGTAGPLSTRLGRPCRWIGPGSTPFASRRPAAPRRVSACAVGRSERHPRVAQGEAELLFISTTRWRTSARQTRRIIAVIATCARWRSGPLLHGGAWQGGPARRDREPGQLGYRNTRIGGRRSAGGEADGASPGTFRLAGLGHQCGQRVRRGRDLADTGTTRPSRAHQLAQFKRALLHTALPLDESSTRRNSTSGRNDRADRQAARPVWGTAPRLRPSHRRSRFVSTPADVCITTSRHCHRSALPAKYTQSRCRYGYSAVIKIGHFSLHEAAHLRNGCLKWADDDRACAHPALQRHSLAFDRPNTAPL